MVRVTLDNLVKRQDDVALIDGVSLEIAPGELMLIAGPNGSGKTLLARLIAGIGRLDEGEIYFDGRVVQALPPLERRVGMVFAEEDLWPHLSVAENVGYALRIRKVPSRERRPRVAEALGLVGIDSLARLRPDRLTAVQRLKTALARALAVKPDLLLLDEPLGRVEPRHRIEVRDLVRQLHQESEATTVLFTNDPRDALGIADRVAVLDLGRILQVGPPRAVYRQPIDVVSARLFGETNLFQGQVEEVDPTGSLLTRTPLGRFSGRCGLGTLPVGRP